MVSLLYNLLLMLICPILLPYAFFKGLPYGVSIKNVLERAGFFSVKSLQRLPDQRVFWIHAVSVGEVRTSLPLIRELKKNYPEAKIVVTCMTFTGNQVAKKLAEIDLALFFPYDLPVIVRRFINQIKPDAIIIIETELWPNFVRVVKSFDIPLLLVNGRISDRSFPRYLMLGRVFESTLEGITVFCMQSAKDERRIRRLGAPPGRILVTGSMKFDMALPNINKLDLETLEQVYQKPAVSKIIVAGSTHAGEEEALVGVFQKLRQQHPSLSLVLIPRHPERCRQLCDELTRNGIATILRTSLNELQHPLPTETVLVVDTVGEVLKFYSWADIIFVGGSLVPVGGHNILEASLIKKAVLFGPYMNNFKEIVKLIKEAYGGIQVKDADDLYHYANLLLNNPEEAQRLGENGFQLLAENRGATARTIKEISRRV